VQTKRSRLRSTTGNSPRTSAVLPGHVSQSPVSTAPAANGGRSGRWSSEWPLGRAPTTEGLASPAFYVEGRGVEERQRHLGP